MNDRYRDQSKTDATLNALHERQVVTFEHVLLEQLAAGGMRVF